ncbi:MAG: hypothetical protein ABEI58_02215 [Candidatus Nanohaloarchaea archaeon]
MTTVRCPECGGEMVWNGYRPLFPACPDCGRSFHVDDCELEED